MPFTDDNRLGAFLRDRRERMDPAALGYSTQRRRTPGLRREEVAQRAHVSATWYTWLEQGRGGAPSVEVLERISRALMLTSSEREHLFLVARGHPPEARYQAEDGISPRIQRVLDALDSSPAFAKTATWELVGWNRAAAAVFAFDQLPAGQRNLLRRMFFDSHARTSQVNWEAVARYAVAAFRADTLRAGASETVKAFVEELCLQSPEFAGMWREYAPHTTVEPVKRFRHAKVGILAMEYSAFSIDGRSDLTLVVFNPATPEDRRRVRSLMGDGGQPRSAQPQRPTQRAQTGQKPRRQLRKPEQPEGDHRQ